MLEDAAPSLFHADKSRNVPKMGKITPELVRKISDRVYALLIADLKIERERRFPQPYRALHKRGKL